jgi:PKD repeat protein
LTHLEFEVVGSPGMSTTLHIASASLNDGAIPVETTDGSFAVNLVYDISGTVHFWEDSAGVPGVLLALEGDRVYTGLSGTDGSYIVSSAPAADYTLTPSKADDANGISAYDASFVLQHSAGLITLSGHQVTAADVNKSGAITSMDAFYILQKAVDLITLPFPGAGVVWDFDPQTRSYANLNQDQTGQDFTAVLLGDVSGNWTASGLQRAPNPTQMPGIAGGRTLTATLSLPQVSVLPGQQVTVPLTLTLPEGEVYGADITVTYDPAVVSATQVLKGALATGWSMASNLTIPGVIQVAMAGATPIHAGGELLLLVFEAGGSAGTETDLALTQGDLNEGGIPTELEHGHLRIAVPVQAGFTAAPTSGPALLTVVFTNTSTGDYTSNLWTFGDGGISAMESPTHTYTAAGVYTVSLTVDGPGGVDTETKTAYVHVSVLSVAGAVEYWEGDVAVPGTLLRLEGDHSYNSTNGANGTYALTGILAGDYILTPSKSDDVQGISAYDASFVLRHTAGLLTLTGYQATAADVNQSGVISSQDASYILLKAVDLIPVPFPGASVVWDFDPQQRSYTNLDGDQADQDFAAILLGDVSGNWPVAGAQQFTASSGSPVIMRVQGGIPNASGIATATALVEPGGTPIYSLDLLLSYDPDFATPLTASSAHLAEGWMVSANLAQAGLARLALAGAVPLSANGELLTITFRVASSPGTRTELRWTRGNINEGQVPVELVDGWLGAWQVYLPLTMRKQ